jgi:hypothetical protein
MHQPMPWMCCGARPGILVATERVLVSAVMLAP